MTQKSQTTMTTIQATEALASQVVAKAYGRRLVPDPDGGYTASIHEFPGCFAEGETADEALTELNAAATAWVAAALESGHRVPEPIDASDHSGKIALRVPRTLHRMAAERAVMEGVSVNQLLVTAVANFLGQRDGLSRALLQVREEAASCFAQVMWAHESVAKTDPSHFFFSHNELGVASTASAMLKKVNEMLYVVPFSSESHHG